MLVKRTKRSFSIGFYLLSGWLPWGVDFGNPDADAPPSLSLCGVESGHGPREWILCCGHTIGPAEMSRWMEAGLVQPGPPDKFSRPTVIAGPHLRAWVLAAWEGLTARSWGARS